MLVAPAFFATDANDNAGNFAIARPTREVLFTVLPREDRHKAKSFIDTAVYQLGASGRSRCRRRSASD